MHSVDEEQLPMEVDPSVIAQPMEIDQVVDSPGPEEGKIKINKIFH